MQQYIFMYLILLLETIVVTNNMAVKIQTCYPDDMSSSWFIAAVQVLQGKYRHRSTALLWNEYLMRYVLPIAGT